ncbi:MAG TPA: glycoside hydrolase family 15 protein [Nitrospirales bacterium]|nr:glycoside hydrolase family 15 protein [Nitrospirales bacterium]
MNYQPIENYGMIGNMHTAALVGLNGSVDWMCFPHFDSPSVFCAILDDDKGGRFRIAPASEESVIYKQFYWPDTNVLITRFLSPDGVGEVSDFMPVGLSEGEPGYHTLIRKVHVARGSMRFRVECHPAFNYARDSHTITVFPEGVRFDSSKLSLWLSSPVPLVQQGNRVTGEFTLDPGQTAIFALHDCGSDWERPQQHPEQQGEELFRQTIEYWRRWLSHCTYTGRWREVVNRSALALKLLTFEPTGAIVAAPTSSLPEGIGGERNWDYRFTWIRDAAFTLYGLLRIGFTDEASRFMGWLEDRCRDLNSDGSLQIMYALDGSKNITETTLDHLDGYKGSRPVRIGNRAAVQLQLDIYGELMDSVYLYNKYGTPISYDLWRHLRQLINWVCDNWQRPDEGIWEVRGGRQQFTYSKLMCWVAVDRALRLADKRSFPADRERWLSVRDAIYEEVMSKGWNQDRQAFVQHYGSESLDASNLLMPLVFFLSPNDPRMMKTLDAILKSPEEGGLVADSLVYRYNIYETEDGLAGEEGTFNICTFWLVEALTRAGRHDPKYLRQARYMFEQILGYANHVGLYAEETGTRGEALGNFPQALTHLGLISAAFNLDRALGKKG